MNVSEHVDTVSPRGLTIRKVTLHGGHDIGTVGTIVNGEDGVVSRISTLPSYQLLCNKDALVPYDRFLSRNVLAALDRL